MTVTQMLIVAGGLDSSGRLLASSEVYQYPAGEVWRAVADLPSPRWGASGASLAGLFYVVGGYDGRGYLDDVVVYDNFTDTFTSAGQLTAPRYKHAVTEVPWRAVAHYCTAETNVTKF